MYYLALLLLIPVVHALIYSLIIYTAVELGGQENYAINVCRGLDAVSRNDCSFVLCAHSIGVGTGGALGHVPPLESRRGGAQGGTKTSRTGLRKIRPRFTLIFIAL